MAKRVTDGSLLTTNERSRIKQIGEPIALLLGRIGFSPDALTLVGFGIVIVAAVQVAVGNWAIAAAVLIAGTLFDGLDGTLARATNRVTPFGEIVVSSSRGGFTGNRGILHDPATRTLLKRRWTTRAWICCTLDWKGVRRVPMAQIGRAHV